ncbi:uncharacterized protein LOC132259889 [Phlebotomus argentipes]|uniref:uncharacterized protein LOC132259889 n=1 Tax=Phlebotomus argentipes TaxID=94469 RepID=UPI002892CEE2|nr:uncharacterized protein LOC132259889 [Phlebotomus argentipes]
MRHSVQSLILLGVVLVSASAALSPREQHNLLTLFRRLEQHPEFYDMDPSYAYDENYNDVRDLEPNDNFLGNWPWLRELLPNANDVDFARGVGPRKHDITAKSIIGSAELSERNPADALPTPLPYIGSYGTRGNLQKKDAHSSNYMSLCHFKICNMGRKRNTRNFHL